MKHTLIILMLALAASTAANAHGLKHKHKTTATTISAKSFLVAKNDGTILREQRGDVVRPIASISKLMVGLLTSDQDLNEELTIPSIRLVHSHIPKSTVTLSRKKLLTLSLVKSDNFATQVLCDNIPNCVEKMNAKAKEIGMTSTHYAEPTGLSIKNVSTAHDLLKLLMYAENNHTVTQLGSLSSAEIVLGKSIIKVNNTNPLVSRFDVVLSKTGFTNPAGGCMVMIINTPAGERIFVLLGSKNVKTRGPEMERLIREF